MLVFNRDPNMFPQPQYTQTLCTSSPPPHNHITYQTLSRKGLILPFFGQVTAEIWPVIANTEVLEVSAAYAGHSGSPFAQSERMVSLTDAFIEANEEEQAVLAPAQQFFYKPMVAGGAKTAVLAMNADVSTETLSFNFKDVPGVTCTTCHVRGTPRYAATSWPMPTHAGNLAAPSPSLCLISVCLTVTVCTTNLFETKLSHPHPTHFCRPLGPQGSWHLHRQVVWLC